MRRRLIAGVLAVCGILAGAFALQPSMHYHTTHSVVAGSDMYHHN